MAVRWLISEFEFNSMVFLGGPITGYWIEKREQHTDRWVPVNIAPCQSTRYTIPSLVEDHNYEFRVIPENEAGRGTPSEPSKLTKVNFIDRARISF